MAEHGIIERTYRRLFDEFGSQEYQRHEYQMLADRVFYYGRYLDPLTREYALHSIVPSLSRVLEHMDLTRRPGLRVLDLGCGLGMQSLIFAQLGAEVVGVDLEPQCIELCRKRQSFFERTLGRPLQLRFIAADFSRLDPALCGPPYDVVFSMSAFAHIPPLSSTVARISALLGNDARVAIWDKNPDWFFLNRFGAAARLPRPVEVAHEFELHGFHTDTLTGGVAAPRQLWRWKAGRPLIVQLNTLARRSLRLAFNYVYLATRRLSAAIAMWVYVATCCASAALAT